MEIGQIIVLVIVSAIFITVGSVWIYCFLTSFLGLCSDGLCFRRRRRSPPPLPSWTAPPPPFPSRTALPPAAPRSNVEMGSKDGGIVMLVAADAVGVGATAGHGGGGGGGCGGGGCGGGCGGGGGGCGGAL
ncbi:uncharacterized protein LOC127240485 [Andrographis paniculata]|uniref:uncharacterized protein LOC127240485 n=1 Tax=Andrographis paniculata TaxID=175694 RepID=UPI0021E94F37|nr:uncharacterized protein LOC127240485 [Andrographis paniculata]